MLAVANVMLLQRDSRIRVTKVRWTRISEMIKHILYQCIIIGPDTVNLIYTYNKQVPTINLNYTLIYELEYYRILDLLYSFHVKK
jgi:hypothetical protein